MGKVEVGKKKKLKKEEIKKNKRREIVNRMKVKFVN
jgi:hypothetical protein